MTVRKRRLATWGILLGLFALAVAVGVDALVQKDASRVTDQESTDGTVTSESNTPSEQTLPRCAEGQLDLAIDMLAGAPTVVLRHASGPPCSLKRTRVSITIRDRRGRRVTAVEDISPFAGDFSPQTEMIAGLIFLARCDQVAPLTATARAGGLIARRGGLPIEGCIRRNVSASSLSALQRHEETTRRRRDADASSDAAAS